MKAILIRGFGGPEVMEFVEAPCPPDIVGINAYITSERFLDHRLDRYPAELHGGNGRDRYVDVEAVRVRGRHIGGFQARLREVHARYGGAIAITEAHLGCSREEQLRWLLEAWNAAVQGRREGIDVRAQLRHGAHGGLEVLARDSRARLRPGGIDHPRQRPFFVLAIERGIGAPGIFARVALLLDADDAGRALVAGEQIPAVLGVEETSERLDAAQDEHQIVLFIDRFI